MKKIFALLSLFLVALLLVGCENPFTKTTNNGSQPQTTTNNNTQSKVLTSELDPEAQKEQNETLKKALSKAVEDSLLNSNATKLAIEFSFEVEADVQLKNKISEASKEIALELEAEESFEEHARLCVSFVFKAEIDTEALTVALSTSFSVSKLELNIGDIDEDTAEMLTNLFFDEEGEAKTFDLFIFYTYSTNTVYISLNSPVKEGIITVINAIFKTDASESVDKILPNDDNYFVLDFNEYLEADANEEEDPEIAKLNDAKANFLQTLNSGAGFVRGQSVASAYRTLKPMLVKYGVMDEESTLDFEAIINMIVGAIADENASEDTEEYAQLVEDLKSYFDENIKIYMSGDDYVAELTEENFMEATLNNEEKTPLIDLFDIDTDSLSQLMASLRINFNFTQSQFDGASVVISANLEGNDTNNVDVEVESDEETEGATEVVELEYDMEGHANVMLTASLKISSTLTLKLEELLPEEVELINMLDNEDTVDEINDFMIENFYHEHAEPVMVEGGEE